MNLTSDLKMKEKKLDVIKSQLKFELNEGEQLMTVIFISTSQKILQSFICKNTDKFSRIENLLYDLEEYKDFKLNSNYFLYGAKTINRHNTLEENGIKNSGVITLVKMTDNV